MRTTNPARVGSLEVDGTVDGVDISVHAADLDAHMGDLYQSFRTGNYFQPWPIGDPLVFALTADQLLSRPLLVVRDLTIDALAIQVTVAGGGGTVARLGIYNDGANHYPGSLVQDYGTVAVDAIAIVAAVSDQALTKGIYWLVVVSDGTPTLRGAYLISSPLGMIATDFALLSAYTGWFANGIGVGALADPFGVGAATFTGAPIQIMPRLKTLD